MSPQALMSLERVERLLSRQQQWESGAVGSLCEYDTDTLLSRKQFVLQYFLGSLKLGRCECLYTKNSAVSMCQCTGVPIKVAVMGRM